MSEDVVPVLQLLRIDLEQSARIIGLVPRSVLKHQLGLARSAGSGHDGNLAGGKQSMKLGELLVATNEGAVNRFCDSKRNHAGQVATEPSKVAVIKE